MGRMGWFDRRMGWDAHRVIGVDVARGLAMIGMFGAHLHVRRDVVVADPSSWIGLVHGRSAIGFALLAGVSFALVTGGPRPVGGQAIVDFRLRTFVRAVLLFALSGLLSMLGTPVAVILAAYAMLFILVLPALGWSVQRLWVTVGVLAVVGPVLTIAVQTFLLGAGIPAHGAWGLAFAHFYPVATWIVFPLAGLAVGRTDLRSLWTQLWLVAGGAVAAVVGYTAGHQATGMRERFGLQPFDPFLPSDPSDPFATEQLPPLTDVLGALPGAVAHDLLTADPHSGTPFEILGSGGFVLAVLGLCLLATRGAGRYVLAPVAAVGALSLTVYTAHLVVIRVFLEDIWATESLDWFAWFTVGALVAATALRLTFGKGPLERGIAAVARRAVRVPESCSVPRAPEPHSGAGFPEDRVGGVVQDGQLAEAVHRDDRLGDPATEP